MSRLADAGMSWPGLLMAVALAFVLAAGIPARAAIPLIVFFGCAHLWVRLLGAEVRTWFR